MKEKYIVIIIDEMRDEKIETLVLPQSGKCELLVLLRIDLWDKFIWCVYKPVFLEYLAHALQIFNNDYYKKIDYFCL